MRLRFTDGNAGTLTYTNNGITVTKAITRQEFSTPVSACN
jgi:serine protease